MKFLLKIIINPISIAVTIVHWIVVAFSLTFEETQTFSKSPTFGLSQPTIFDWLLYLNTPSNIIIEFIVHPVLSLFGRNVLTESLGLLTLFICVSFQWLIIGYLIYLVCKQLKFEETKISLN